MRSVFVRSVGRSLKRNRINISTDTELILSSDAMVKHLDTAKNEEREGKGVKVLLDDIWKRSIEIDL